MCVPTVTSRPGSSARSADVIRSSHRSAAAGVGRDRAVRVLVAEVPRPHRGVPGERGRRRRPARSSWASTISGSAYQLRSTRRPGCDRAARRPPGTGRRRRRRPVAHAGIQFTPLMWPVNSVTISCDAGFRGGVGGVDDVRRATARSMAIGGGLEVLPAQEDADGVHAGGGDPGEVAPDDAAGRSGGSHSIAVADGPVVDAEAEADQRTGIGDHLLVHRDVLVDHAVDAEALDRARTDGVPVELPARGRRRRPRPSTSATSMPVVPSSTSSGIDPRSNAITGVPQAIASTTLKPKGSSKSMRWSRAQRAAEERRAVLGRDRAEEADPVAVDAGRDLVVEVLLVLDDPGDHAAASPAARRSSMAATVPLSGWMRPKKAR